MLVRSLSRRFLQKDMITYDYQILLNLEFLKVELLMSRVLELGPCRFD